MQYFGIWKLWWSRLSDVLLGRERHMRIRTSQMALASVLMLACMAVMYLLAQFGEADAGHVRVWMALCAAGLVVFGVLIRSGVSLRWSDPSLALPQMLYAIACDAAAFVLAEHGRGLTLPLLAVILMFGIFGLSSRQVLGVAVYALALFSAAVVYVLENPSTDESPVLFASYLFMVFSVVAATTVLTWRLGKIRDHVLLQKLRLTEALAKIQRIATRDELTGTANRRFMLEQLQQEIQRANRTGAALMVALLDIDYFKSVNDTYGHQAGDRCLQAFAQAVQASIRTTDRLARWGGEEFLILLTDTDFVLGLACLERVRAQVAQMAVAVGEVEIRVTVSIGVTQYQPGDAIEQTIDRADLALYAAKAQGRDRVVSA